jgi:hypothetical protein
VSGALRASHQSPVTSHHSPTQVPWMGFEPTISTLRGWRPLQAGTARVSSRTTHHSPTSGPGGTRTHSISRSEREWSAKLPTEPGVAAALSKIPSHSSGGRSRTHTRWFKASEPTISRPRNLNSIYRFLNPIYRFALAGERETMNLLLPAEGEGVEPSRACASSRFERGAIAHWLALPYFSPLRLSPRTSRSVWMAGFEPAFSGSRSRRIEPGSPTSRSRFIPLAPRLSPLVSRPSPLSGTRGTRTLTALVKSQACCR